MFNMEKRFRNKIIIIIIVYENNIRYDFFAAEGLSIWLFKVNNNNQKFTLDSAWFG